MTRLGGGRGGGWMMGDGKEAAKSSWQDSKAFLSRFSSRFKLSSGPTSLTQRHHTNQKTWGVSSSHQDDRGKEESGPFESEGTRWKYRRRQNREEIARQIFAWTWIAKMSTFSWRKDEFATGYQNDEEEMEDRDRFDTFNRIK